MAALSHCPVYTAGVAYSCVSDWRRLRKPLSASLSLSLSFVTEHVMLYDEAEAAAAAAAAGAAKEETERKRSIYAPTP